MKKTVTFIIILSVILSFATNASADFSFSDLNIKIPDKLQEVIDGYDTDELAGIIKEKLDTINEMSDEELFTFVKDFCTKYSVEADDAQIEKISKYVRNAATFNLDEIKEKIESVKTTAGFFQKAADFVKNLGSKVGEFFSSFSGIGQKIKDEIVELFIRFF